LIEAKAALVKLARFTRAPPRRGLGKLNQFNTASRSGAVGGTRIFGSRRIYSACRGPRSIVTTAISAISKMKALYVFITVLRTRDRPTEPPEEGKER
jgi:hypothetical protein